jgi:hypothetical protein
MIRKIYNSLSLSSFLLLLSNTPNFRGRVRVKRRGQDDSTLSGGKCLMGFRHGWKAASVEDTNLAVLRVIQDAAYAQELVFHPANWERVSRYLPVFRACAEFLTTGWNCGWRWQDVLFEEERIL